MAAPKENLLSLGHLTCTERNTFTKAREHKLKRSINRPLRLQADFSTLQSHQNLRAMHLQQRWQELKERELVAQQHNRQLLQQFEEAQDTLRKMLTLTTAMKTIRMEYEQYVEESLPRWEQQFKEKTKAAQRKRMEDYLKSHLKNTEDPETESFANRSLLSQGPTTKPQRISASQKHHSQNSQLDYNQDGSSRLPYMQSSLQTHPQSQAARFPIRAPYHPQGSSHPPSSFLSPPIFSHPLQLHHLTSTPAHRHPWPGQNLPGRASSQSDYPWSWTAGAAGIPSGSEALWGQLYTEELPPERVEAELSTASSSRRERGGGSRSTHLSQELDIKPVRLSSGAAESSESSRESCQTSRDKRKKREKRGRSRRASSERERCSSHESSRTSSAVITAAVTAAQSSESDASSEKSRTSMSSRRRTAGLAVGSPRDETVVKERTRSNGDDLGNHKEESQSTAEESRSEEAGNRSPDDKPESCGEESGSQREEESGSVSIEIENGGADEIEKERSSSEESSAGEKDDEEEENEKDLGEGDEEVDDGEEKEDSQRDKQQEERDVKDDDEEASERKNTTEEEEEQQSEDEMEEQEPEEESDHEVESDKLKNEGGENGKEGSASSQDEEVDEDESEGREDKKEEDGESDEEEQGEEEEEEQKIDEAQAEERDSDDSIISPQNKSKRMHVIPEEASEDEDEEEEGSKTGSSDDDVKEFSDEDIEHLLAPQEQSQKKGEKDLRAEEKPKALQDKVEIFQVDLDRPTKMDHSSDSEEFDHFYD